MVTPNIKKGVNILDRYADIVKKAGNRWNRRADKAFEARKELIPNIFDIDKYNAYREADMSVEEAKALYGRIRNAQGVKRAEQLSPENYDLLKPNPGNGYCTRNPAFLNEDRYVEFEKMAPNRWIGSGTETGNRTGDVLTDAQMAEYVGNNPNTYFNGPIPGEREFIPEEHYRVRFDDPMVQKYMNEREERVWEAFNNGDSPINPASRILMTDEQRFNSDMRARQRFIDNMEWYKKRDYLSSQGYTDREIRRIIGDDPKSR